MIKSKIVGVILVLSSSTMSLADYEGKEFIGNTIKTGANAINVLTNPYPAGKILGQPIIDSGVDVYMDKSEDFGRGVGEYIYDATHNEGCGGYNQSSCGVR